MIRATFRPFHRLQWQLSFSYMLVTIAALLAVEISLFVIALVLLNSNLLPDVIMQALRQQFATRVGEYLDQPQPDLEGLNSFLGAYTNQMAQPLQTEGSGWQVSLQSGQSDGEFIVLDTQQRVLWSAETSAKLKPVGLPFDTGGIAGLDDILRAALNGENETRRLFIRAPQDLLIMAIPVHGQAQNVVGILVFTARMPTITSPDFLRQLLPTLAVSLLLFTLLAGGVGTVFGFFTARRFTVRLNQVMRAAGAWSRGDFSTFISDHNDDELGALAHRLNVMAEQLQNLLQTRQDLAMLEERNRIARELHDSVKQQVFATAMQLGAARALLPDDDSPASQRLAEAERLTRMAQSELTHLIQEMRPVALEGKGLARALHEMAGDWSRQTGISLQFHLINEPVLPLLKDQAMYRVAQEALANIARHSGAHNVEMSLGKKDHQVKLTISDDGNGFDLASPSLGLGLRSMRERVSAAGGTISITSAPGQGARLEVSIPIQ